MYYYLVHRRSISSAPKSNWLEVAYREGKKGEGEGRAWRGCMRGEGEGEVKRRESKTVNRG